MERSRHKWLIAAVGVFSCIAIPQTTTKPHKVLTPEQQQFQAEIAQWRTEREALQTKVSHDLRPALKSTDDLVCNGAKSRIETETCMEEVLKSAGGNYAAFTSDLRSILALAYPAMPSGKPIFGPTGSPQTSSDAVSEFDRLESQSKAYREAATTAAYNRCKGGAEAPVCGLDAAVKLLHVHLDELKFIYGAELSNY